jgi:hypothetical protein
MFNMLNTEPPTGKNPAWMCKFLVTLSAFFHGLPGQFRNPVHLLESMELRNAAMPLNGLRIAFSTLQPVRIQLRYGKG